MESHIHYPTNKLEVLMCVTTDKEVDCKKKKKNNNNNKKKKNEKKGKYCSFLSEQNYDLILDRMEEGFHILVAGSVDEFPQTLIHHEPRGSLLFTFDNLQDIKTPNFIQKFLEHEQQEQD
jgi:hypothetical protein